MIKLWQRIVQWFVLRDHRRKFSVICALAQGPAFGLDIVRHSEHCQTGSKLSRSGIYVLLGRMESRGLIKGRTMIALNADVPPRRMYTLTNAGVAWFRLHFVPPPPPKATATIHDEGN